MEIFKGICITITIICIAIAVALFVTAFVYNIIKNKKRKENK